MADIELVEQLRSRANVTYDEAKEALDATGDDILDAIIYLEKQGKIPPPASGGGKYSSKGESAAQPGGFTYEGYRYDGAKSPPEDSFGSMLRRFFGWVCNVIQKSFEYHLVIKRKGDVVTSIPVLVLVVLAIWLSWLIIPALIAGLFFDCRYSFRNTKENGRSSAEKVNSIMDEVAEATETLKTKLKEMDYKGD